MNAIYDVAVVGAGSMGSAAAYYLALRGLRVIAIEQFDIVHKMGSHSGDTRIIRHAYHESPDYVPLVLRADELWRQLEAKTGVKLLIRTGGIVIGAPDAAAVAGAVLACQKHQLPYERIGAAEIHARWPQFRLPADWRGCYDPQMGFLLVAPCIQSYLRQAAMMGTTVQTNTQLLSYGRKNGGYELVTSTGRIRAQKIIFCSGAWTSRLLNALTLPLTVKRRTLAWFRAQNRDRFLPDHFPVFLADTTDGLIYGFPIFGHDGIKIANHHSKGEETTAERADRTHHEQDAEDVRRFIGRHLAGVTTEILQGEVCLYTLTPDEHFVIDFHPNDENILIATGFSGHGFKFASVVGEILADLCVDGKTSLPIATFQLARFAR